MVLRAKLHSVTSLDDMQVTVSSRLVETFVSFYTSA